MYTIRIRRQGPNPGPFEIVVDNYNLFDILNILEYSSEVSRFQVWMAGVGMCDQKQFKFAGFTKWVNGPLFPEGL